MDEKESRKDERSYDSALSGPGRAVNESRYTSPTNAHRYMQNDTSTPRSGVYGMHLSAHFSSRSADSIASSVGDYVVAVGYHNSSELPSFSDMQPTLNSEYLRDDSTSANETMGEEPFSSATEVQDLPEVLHESFNSLEIASRPTISNINRPHMPAQAQREPTNMDNSEHVPGVMLVRHTQTSSGVFRTIIRYFPKYSLHEMRELLQQHHPGQFIVCPSGPSQDNLPRSSAFSTSKDNSIPRSDSVKLIPSFSNTGSSAPKTDSEKKGKGPESDPVTLFFACPLAKHNNSHYARIFNPCTLPPGLPEFRRVKEHVQKYHSYKLGCPLCKLRWPTSQYEHEFAQHKPYCPKMDDEGLRSVPEALNSHQMEVLENNDYRGWSSGYYAWRDLYEKLFPNTVVPEPYYDYYVLSAQQGPYQIMQAPGPSNEPMDFTNYTSNTRDHTTGFAQTGMDAVSGMDTVSEMFYGSGTFLEDELSIGSTEGSSEQASAENNMLDSIREPGVPADCLPAKPQGRNHRDSAYGSMDPALRGHHSREASIASSQGTRPSELSMEEKRQNSKAPTIFRSADEQHEIEFHDNQDEQDLIDLFINEEMVI